MACERKWLKEARQTRKMATYEVAAKAQISQTHYSDIENGKRGPSVKMAKRIAAVLLFDWTAFFRDVA